MQYGFGQQAQQARPPMPAQQQQRPVAPGRGPMPGAVQGANPSYAFGKPPMPGMGGGAQPGAARAQYGQQQMMGRPGAGQQMFGQQQRPQQGGYGQLQSQFGQQQGGMKQPGAGGRCPTCGK